MMDIANLTPQLHAAHWGWTIALFLWLVGLSGMGMFLHYWVRNKMLVYICTAAGILGTLLVASHLGRMLNLPVAVFYSLIDWKFNFGSWMLIGICLLSVQCVITLIASGVYAGFIRCEKLKSALFEKNCLPGILAFVGVFCTIYSGFLLTQASGITLWHSALIPVIWIMSGMGCALATIEILAETKVIDEASYPWVRKTSLWTEGAEMVAIFAFLHIAANYGEPGARAGVASILHGENSTLFWFGVVLIGLLVPFFINLKFANKRYAVMLAAACAIIGALMLRATVLFAGYYDPIL